MSPSTPGGDVGVNKTFMTDWELLQDWNERKSDRALSELWQRPVGFVHASARRQLADAALAVDVTQVVFLLLARKARGFKPDLMLPSWLFRTTRFLAARAVRGERRRK